MLPGNSERHSLKLKELTQLKNEIKLLKDKKRRTKTSSLSLSQAPSSQLNYSGHHRKVDSEILIINDESNKTHKRTKSNISNKSQPSKSKSPSRSYETSFEIMKPVSLQELKTKPAVSKPSSRPNKHETPKFEQKYKSFQVQRSIPSRHTTETAERLSPQSKTAFSKSLTGGILKENIRPKGETEKISIINYSPQKEQTERNLKTLTSRRDFKSSGRRARFSMDTKAKSEAMSPKPSERASVISRSRSKADLSRLTELLEKSKELKSAKDKSFTFLDEEEEYFVRKKLTESSLDKLISKYRTMFYKSREMKDLFNELSDNNYLLRLATEDLKEERERLLNENEKLKGELSYINADQIVREKEAEGTLREYEKKILNIEQENDYLNHKINELEERNDMLSSKIGDKSVHITSLPSYRGNMQSLRAYADQVDNNLLEDKVKVIFI